MYILYLILQIIIILFSVLSTLLIITFIIFILVYTLTSKEYLHKKLFLRHHKINIHQDYVDGKISKKDYIKYKNVKRTT